MTITKPIGRYGYILVDMHGNVTVHRRWFPSLPSLWDQWLDSRWRRLPNKVVRMYFNHPIRSSDYLVLAYAQAGTNATSEGLRIALNTLESIARTKGVRGIVCHATHPKLTDRVMRHFGYERHAMSLPGRHFIRRLADTQEN